MIAARDTGGNCGGNAKRARLTRQALHGLWWSKSYDVRTVAIRFFPDTMYVLHIPGNREK